MVALKSGVRLAVDDTRGKGLPVVFQHGLCGDARQPADVFPPAADLRRITVECRGHGASDAGRASTYSIARFAEDVAEVMSAQGLGASVVGGISMGAAIALRLAVKRPEFVRGLIIARPAWVVGRSPGNMQPNAEVGRLLAKHDVKTARRIFESGKTAAHLQKNAPDNLASLRGFFSREPVAVTAALLGAISADEPGITWKELRSIAVPTLVIGHQQDFVHPFGMAQQIAELVPRAKLVEITPKAVDKARYVADFRFVLHDFLKDF